MSGEPIVPVDYEFVAGKHFFTAATVLGRGLCVAHGDLRTAFDEVGRQMKTILSENHGFEPIHGVRELAGFEEFRTFLSTAPGTTVAMSPRRFYVEWAAWALRPPGS
jgi:hypothetical protein